MILDGEFRLHSPRGRESFSYCPITAVCVSVKKRYYRRHDVSRAARRIGLDENQTGIIVRITY